MAHMENWKQVKLQDKSGVIKVFFNTERAQAKECKYDEFWNVAVFLQNISPYIKKNDKEVNECVSGKKWNGNVFCTCREIALVLMRIAMIARRIDTARIKAYKFKGDGENDVNNKFRNKDCGCSLGENRKEHTDGNQ